jgi:DNA-binding transcriptional MerR regulator
MNDLFSTGQVARLLGLRPYQLEYAHASQSLPEPAQRFLNKRAYTPDDIRRVAEHFGVALDGGLSGADGGKEGA